MALQLSTTVQNARLDAIESTIGTTVTLEVRTGTPPANCAAADTGSVLATITLPADWMSAAASGVKALLGSWTVSASASGTPGHFRVKASSVCHIQGTCAVGSGDMNFSATISLGGTVTVTSFSITDANA